MNGAGRSLYFCAMHRAASNTRKFHLQQKRRILIYLEKRGFQFNKSLSKKIFYEQLSTALDTVSKDPESLIKEKVNLNSNLAGIFETLLYVTSRFYPITYKKLSRLKITSPTDKSVFVNSVIITLENSIIVRGLSLQVSMLEVNKEVSVWFTNLMRVIARHEAVGVVNEFDFQPGPVTSKFKKADLRKKLKVRVEQLNAEGHRVKQKQLAQEFNLSEQRISVLMKELKKKV
jgi:hypothetical protein